MEKSPIIQGVGNGTEGGNVVLHRFECPVVNEPGGDIPLILGLRSMSEKNGVLFMERGKEMLVFPGLGDYTVGWFSRTQMFPLTPAPSGHLIMPCG